MEFENKLIMRATLLRFILWLVADQSALAPTDQQFSYEEQEDHLATNFAISPIKLFISPQFLDPVAGGARASKMERPASFTPQAIAIALDQGVQAHHKLLLDEGLP